MIGCFALAALAQDIPDGNFESGDLGSWELFGDDGEFEVYVSSTEGDYVLRLERDDEPWGACSRTFVATRIGIAARMKNSSSTDDEADTEWWVENPEGVILASTTLTPQDDPYGDYALDIGAACGATVAVCVEPEPNARMYYDDFALDGPLCPAFVDADGDGFCPGGTDRDGDGACDSPREGGATDCDDGDAGISPVAVEDCDGIDDDCDLLADDGLPTGRWWADADGDGFGDSSTPPREGCAPAAYVANGEDCDDQTGEVHPGAPDAPLDGVDGDCDGTDAAEPGPWRVSSSTWPEPATGCGCSAVVQHNPGDRLRDGPGLPTKEADPGHESSRSRAGLCSDGCGIAWVAVAVACGFLRQRGRRSRGR